MDLDRIEQLLEKYWECETSGEEEQELKEFFNNNEVPEHLKSVAPLFTYFSKEEAVGDLGDDFDNNIIERLQTEKAPKKGKVVSLIFNAMKVAAVGVILITAGYFMKQEYIDKKDSIDPYMTGTFEDPEKAFEETKKALMLLSKNMNVGKKQVQKVGVFHEAQEKIKETETL
ncbi:hypothetical protein [Fulvivirga ligni]|uniref:hypothetical protein n=1 Tax=Fulvivirga ligni TaxID=2904246 RepID=UPI001F27DF6D|nr:hypothetical protein [Fulvivirga ligni]UII23596.1 hypothetical protein LVD16_10190 [Fulvivirga ligni]